MKNSNEQAALGSKHFSLETRLYSNEKSAAYFRVTTVVIGSLADEKLSQAVDNQISDHLEI